MDESEKKEEEQQTPNPKFVVESPYGQVSIDMKAYADAKMAANKLMPKQPRTNMFD